jgi:hypothetical protein
MNIEKLKKQITPVLEKYGVRRASLFGSSARGQDTEDSDIDILVELGEKGGLFTLASLKRELEQETGAEVDLLTFNSINPLLKEDVLKDELSIYEQQ